MAQAKRTTRGKATAQAAKKPAKKQKGAPVGEIVGLIMAVVGIYLFVCVVMRSSGIVGDYIKDVLRGLFGFAAYVAPLGLTALGGAIIMNGVKDRRNIGQLVYVALAYCLFCMAGLFVAGRMNNSSFFDFVADAYHHGQATLTGTGAVPALLIYPVYKFLGGIGAFLVFLTAVLVICIVKFRLSLKKAGEGIREAGGRLAQSTGRRVEEMRVERQIRRAPRSELFIDDVANDSAPIDLPEVELMPVVDFDAQTGAADEDEGLSLLAETPSFTLELFDDAVDEAPADFDRMTTEDLQVGPAARPKKEKAPADDGDVPDFTRLREKAEKPQAEEVEIDTRTEPKPYEKPGLGLLNAVPTGGPKMTREDYMRGAKQLEETLLSFGVKCTVINVSAGPAITRYELSPAPGVKISRIVNLANDIALSMAASGVRIEAPIPGKAAIGVEIPNAHIATVHLREVVNTQEFQKATSPLAFGLGKDIAGKTVVADIAKMPHVLIAGATGSGKSVCINTIILSLLYRSTPEEVRMIMIDPKVVELSSYNDIPHLLIPVVTDPKKAAGALNWAVQEMTRRYKLFAETGARDIFRYREVVADNPEAEKLPQIVIIIDELADLMMVAPNDVEDAICRIAQLARAAGMHLVIATQRPSVDVITGIIKANIPSRIAFAVSSQVDSRTILDMAGAEKLLGRGDMLFNPSGAIKPVRVQGAFVTDEEVERVTEFIKAQTGGEYSQDVMKDIEKFQITQKGAARGRVEDDGADFGAKLDPKISEAVEVVCDMGQASTSMLQRKLRLGYARAARVMDELEDLGVISQQDGSKPREVIMSRAQALEAIQAFNEGEAS